MFWYKLLSMKYDALKNIEEKQKNQHYIKIQVAAENL